MFNVAHIGYRVILGQAADLHRELLNRTDLRSFYFVERVLDTGIAPDRNTYIFMRIPRNPFIERIDQLFTERVFRDQYERRLDSFYERHIKRFDVDLIHAHFGMAGSKLERVKEKTLLPLVTSFYGVDASQCLRSSYWLPRLQRLFEYGDRFIVLSEIVRDRLIDKGCPKDKIRICNCMVDFDFPYNPRVYDGGVVKLITAARFVEKKGYPFLLKVVERLVRKGMKIRLTAVGYGGDKRKIESLIRDLGLGNAVTLVDTSNVSDFAALYNDLLKKHHIFVLASTTSSAGDDEGGPALSMVTAQAAGLPVICTPFVGAERSVIDGETGFIAPEEISKFSNRLEDLITNSDAWNRMGERGSAFVREEFSKSGQAQKIVGIYRELLSEKYIRGGQVSCQNI